MILVSALVFLGLAATSQGLTRISEEPYIGAIVIDADTGKVLFEDNADKRAYPASVVKLMDLLIILERIEEGKLKLNDYMHVTRAAAVIGGTQVWLEEGESFTVDDMLAAMVIKSANDAAAALAINIAGSKAGFVKIMNERAKALGMTATTFRSVHGLPPDERKNQKPDETTARDIATLSREVVKHKKALEYTSTVERMFRPDGHKGQVKMESHNPLLRDFEGCDGLKTGYIRAAGFCISATAKRNGRRVIVVMLGCRSKAIRNARVRELLAEGFLNLPLLTEVKADPEVVEKKVETKPKRAGKSFGARLKSFFKAIFVFLLSVFLLVAGVGIMLGLRWMYLRRRDKWKYRW